MNIEQAEELLRRYRMGLCNEEEKIAVEKWFASLAENDQWEWSMAEKDAFRQKLQMRIASEIDEVDTVTVVPLRRRRLSRLAAAAAVIIMICAGGYSLFFNNKAEEKAVARKVVPQPKKDIQPGVNGAILTLSNGQKIVLDSAGNGTLATQSDVNIINRNGQLIYDSKNGGSVNNSASEEVVYNTISTPLAKEFKLQLSDGTRVWLNAGSSIRYPAKFGEGSRTVEVSGEVYFEVSSIFKSGKGKTPFLVKILSANGEDGGTVEVTGTHFNIDAYEDESLIKTTLLEGSIKFKKGDAEKLLLPGQQGQLNKNGTIRILKNINIDDEIAWKNGYFTYNRTNLPTVMKQISRWYDIEVKYENGIVPDDKYWGDIQRDATLSTVLKVLEMSGVRFRVEGRRVTVIKGIRG